MKALEGIKVIDLSKWLPGQYCGMMLGDFGAEVIKIDDIAGDNTRQFIPQKEKDMSYWHLALNRNKKGMAIDLRTEAGKSILHKLILTADVVLEGFRPGFMAKLGLDYETISKENPRLVYCSITGFGQTGKYKHKPAHDLNIVGLAGITSLDDVGSACVADIQVSALGGSMNAVSGILLALFARERTGRGQYVDVSLYNTALSMEATAVSSLWGCQETGAEPFGRIAHYYNIYKTKDGKYLTVGTIEPKFWQELCRLIGRDDLGNRQFDFAHGEELGQALAEVFLLKTQQEWLALIDDRDFCVTPVCSLAEALNSELTSESGMIGVRDEDIGEIKYLQPAIKLSATPGAIDRRAPRLGEHREEILKSLGYTAEEITRLKENHVI
ncbi:MAG: CoA transferase [Acholeplasmataceae bacterium]|nr:CoA transferase [Acholeplasmataceae bacterium]